MKEYVMGNGAIALGALTAGVSLVAGYPGTPSSEIIETVSKYPHQGVHLEWSVNEKAALEVAVAAAYSGARALVTMKQMGLNVASDPLMSVAYVGVKGGLVIVSADDPGPISSQTEQDTRRFADFARIPVFDPSSPEEAYTMIQDAFAYSEKYGTPVLFRPTTRVCHAYASIDIPESFAPGNYEGFVKDSGKWVIFPRLSNMNHGKMEKRNVEIAKDFSSYRYNTVEGENSEKAVVASGVSYAYVKECLRGHRNVKLIRVGTAFPFPEDLVLQALEGVREVLCIEELSPYVEEQILKTAGRHHLDLLHCSPQRRKQRRTLRKNTEGIPGRGDRLADHGCLRRTRTASKTSGPVCGMSAQGILLRCKAGDERAEGGLLRRYRLLYARQCHASGYGRYLSLHGRWHHNGAGLLSSGQRCRMFCFCR